MKGQGGETRRFARAAALTVAMALLAFEVSAAAAENDAGSGMDAGDSPEGALRLAGMAPHQGNLTRPDAADWFRHKEKVSEPACLKATLSTPTFVQATLVAVGAGEETREASTEAIFARATSIGVASPSLRGAFLNVSPSQPAQASYQFGLDVLRASALPPGDAGSGADAPATAAGAPSLAGLACLGGRLNGGAGDWADTYALSGYAGDGVVVSLADTTGRVSATLSDASGAVVGTIGSGSLVELAFPATSNYSLALTTTASAPSTYLIGMCDPDCGPPSRPCRPMCSLVIGDDW